MRLESERIFFVQPRHPYAPKEGKGHIYLPNSLLTAAARFQEAGVAVEFQDANVRPPNLHAPFVAVSLAGAPYVPEVKKLLRPDKRLIIGGQVINGFVRKNSEGRVVDRAQFDQLFGQHAVVGNDDYAVAHAFGVEVEAIPSAFKTSLIPMYESISDEDMRAYLSHEISFFLSQGCNFACKFCAAVRTIRDPLTGDTTKVKEEYRDMEIVERDLRYLFERATELGLSGIDIYLSNLDMFQTPRKVGEFAEVIQGLKKMHPDFSLHMRALATVDSFTRLHQKNPKTITNIIDAGIHTIGFGIDGTTPAVWKSIRKGHNTQDKCLEAIRLAREEYGITPEILMVFGHPEENEESLQAAVTFTLDMVERYGAVPRPHVSKDIIPGNEHWMEPHNASRVAFLLSHPEYFQALDFTALPSLISHPDPVLRALTERYYLAICNIPGNVTKPVYSISPELGTAENTRRRKLNMAQYDR